VEQLGDRQVGDVVVDWHAKEDDPLPKQVRVDVKGTLPARVLLDHHRNQPPLTCTQRRTPSSLAGW
jgi:hypothetical protein